MTLDKYQVLSILGGNHYKVKNLETSEVLIWKAIDYRKLESEALLERLRERKTLSGNCLVKFYDHVLHTETETLYIVTEYCEYGSLSDIVRKCRNDDALLGEEFLWTILYKMCRNLNDILDVTDISSVSTSEIFIDQNCDVKFYCFDGESKRIVNKTKSENGNVIDRVLRTLCCLQPDVSECQRISNYSPALQDLVDFVGKLDLNRAIEAVLHHPTAVINSNNNNCTVFKTRAEQRDNDVNNRKENLTAATRLENIKNREMFLRNREEMLDEREHFLLKRERKITLLERLAKQKMTQANLYLKRCKQSKSKHITGNIDTSLSPECDDTIIIPTSKKLHVEKIPKLNSLPRTASQRHIRFKGHSPLKEIHNTFGSDRCKSLKKTSPSSGLSESTCKSGVECEIDSSKSKKSRPKFNLTSVFTNKSKKVERNAKREIVYKVSDEIEPIVWTEGDKRQAFELLRIMNEEKIDNVKHTCL